MSSLKKLKFIPEVLVKKCLISAGYAELCWVKKSVLDNTSGSPGSSNQIIVLNFTLENP